MTDYCYPQIIFCYLNYMKTDEDVKEVSVIKIQHNKQISEILNKYKNVKFYFDKQKNNPIDISKTFESYGIDQSVIIYVHDVHDV